MKCPCCGAEAARDFLIVGDMLHRSDGTRRKFKPYPLMYFNRLLAGERIKPDGPAAANNTMYVHISKLRGFLRDNDLPYVILLEHGHYVLKELIREQNHDPTQRPQDVHPRSGLHDIRRGPRRRRRPSGGI